MQQVLEEKIQQVCQKNFLKSIKDCSNQELFEGLLALTAQDMENRPPVAGKKKLYYVSAEFLIGKLLSNNLINLGIYDGVRKILEKNGKDLAEIEELEVEPSLGNGGLGRLAACFLDSIASLGLSGDGIGLNYHFGLFEQKFGDHKQTELKNDWITPDTWLVKRKVSFSVPFRTFTAKSVLYDIAVPGYGQEGVNQLHLFDIDTLDESLVPEGSIDFDKKAVAKNLTLFLYPDDSDRDGQLLRIYQQYFMVSSGAQLILREMKERGYALDTLPEHVAIQINDTHPSMIIPELIRLLLIEGFTMDEAVSLVEKTCAYTNHTILAEALEKWSVSFLEEVVPHLLPIIYELNNRVRKKLAAADISEKAAEKLLIVDKDQRVHMAHMDIHYGYSVNGVAALHTEILKNTELHAFYELYPEKFNNKTNGITFRRWLLHCNPQLSDYIESLIGPEFKTDATKLEGLMQFADKQEVLDRLAGIKQGNKLRAAAFLKQRQGIDIDPDSIYDIQMKRLHEYKRQQMNALYAIYKYLKIKGGEKPKRPITMIFGAKAAPAYIIAKDIIHLILCLQELTTKDPEVAPYFKVVMVENYNVTAAETMIQAADISEQISLASKEASGTGNMKFMLNGAVTLGTEDGANVEIHELVGDENIYIFGADADQVVHLYEEGPDRYNARKIYESDEMIRELVDFIIGPQLLEIGDEKNLSRLHREIAGKDWFMALLDTKEYIQMKEKVFEDYEDQESWNRKCLVNIAKAGFFSSDRTIRQYNEDIWKL